MDKGEPILTDEPELPDEVVADPIVTPAEETVSHKSVKGQVSDLVADVRKLAHAEIEYYRTKLSVNMAATKTVVILFGAAAAAGITSIVALILGVLLIISQYMGPIAATGITVGTAILVTSILSGMAIKRARKLPIDEDNP